ncbi:unnamed protein product [Mytilus coruscus]|uniref:Sushi domain-containing protein n=1 Tax=Mytilus coruscus TaxID=42192 RepID=A0A6J8D8S8_MYTCO|nr:unnamed protein product [Mytilus coruscus]
MKTFFLFCLLFNLTDKVDGVLLSDFYPFGKENGDRRAPTNDDGSTEPIPVSSLFPFFNHQHASLIVNTNGVISFLGTMRTYTPSPFPLASKRRLIAPYWTDIDTGKGGDKCTFQCVLVTNGRHSFTIFLYNKIEWTTGTASGSDSSSGLGGTPAQVGFDAGDGFNFYAIDASRTSNIINVTKMSIIDFPGKFIFRVDSTSIKKGGCNVEEDMTNGLYNFQLNFTEEAAIVKLSTNDINSPYYWSDMFTVNMGIEQSQAICDKMLNEDAKLPSINTDDVQPCPCTLNVASLDTTRFSVDPFCHKLEGSVYKCANQPFAQICFRQNVASRSRGYDHQCCYDEVGVLMNPNGYYGSGYVNRYHYHGDEAKNIPFFSNFVYDTIPYKHCCIYTSEDSEEVNSNFGSCASFYSRRPPNSCLNYVPPRPGDPHFVTFDGHAYTFNPAGEFAALSNGNLSLQLRMEQIGSSQASSVTSFVARPYPGADTIEVQTNQIRGIDVLVNGIVLDLDSSISKVNSVEGTTIEKISDDPPTVVTMFYTEGLSIRSSSKQNVLNLVILTSPDRQTGNLTGLFGDNDGVKDNDLVSKHKDVVEGNASASDIHHKFGLSWRIEESESLFTYEGGKSYSSYQNENFKPMFEIPEDVPTHVTDLCGSKIECIYDFLVTNNTDFGQMSADSTDDFDHLQNITVPTVSCGFPSNTSNAVWNVNGLTEGSIALLNCTKGYYDPVDVKRVCLSFGNWSSVNTSCIPYCGGPPSVSNATWFPDLDENGKRELSGVIMGFMEKKLTSLVQITEHGQKCKNPYDVQNGKWNVNGLQNGSTAIMTCNDNYLLRSAVEIKCNANGQWDQTNATCISSTTTRTVDQTVETSSEVHSSAITIRELSTTMPATHISSKQNLSISTQATQTASSRKTKQRSSQKNMSLIQSISTLTIITNRDHKSRRSNT